MDAVRYRYEKWLAAIPRQKNTAVILGNGPSLRGFDFINNLKGFDCFGMNAAYRYWERIGWFPRYYSCLDRVTGVSHKDAIRRLVLESPGNGIEKFFLLRPVAEALGDVGTLPQVVCWEDLHESGNPIFTPIVFSTGSHTCLWASTLGYQDIILLGIDANYVNFVDGSRHVEGQILEMEKTPESNPNYFFDDYQRTGDRYNVPDAFFQEPERAARLTRLHYMPDAGSQRADSAQMLSWRRVRPKVEFMDSVVVNASPQSRLLFFPKCDFADARDTVAKRREHIEQARNDPGYVGVFTREARASLDEGALAEKFLPSPGIMLNVGAMGGGTCIPFLQKGWEVHAFEPDPLNRERCLEKAARFPLLTVDPRAVSCVSGQRFPFYISPQSRGISGMSAFTEDHRQNGYAETITLHDYCVEKNITSVDFLKIDTEGFDLMALWKFPFDRIKPTCILCEFEDNKTVFLGGAIGYDVHDLGNFLQEQGYVVYMSEWYPVVRYGVQHNWRRIVQYPSMPLKKSWGNFLALRHPVAAEEMSGHVRSLLKTG